MQCAWPGCSFLIVEGATGWTHVDTHGFDVDHPARVSIRTKPFVTFYTTKLYDPEDYPHIRDEREWQVQSSDLDLTCGMSFESFEDAMIGARLLAIREVLGWTLTRGAGYEIEFDMTLTCWCGWSRKIAGCYSDPIVEHVKSAHPEHPVVKG